MAHTFFARAPRGVAALVPGSDDKIQITLLILGRGVLSIHRLWILVYLLVSGTFVSCKFVALVSAFMEVRFYISVDDESVSNMNFQRTFAFQYDSQAL